MNSTVQGLLTVVARLFIVTIFLMSALGNKIPQFSSVAQYMASEGVPAAQVLLVGAIVFLIVGGLSILLGFYARVGALLLFTFLVLATYFFHDFWTLEGDAVEGQMIHFMKNLSMMGTMLFIMAVGSGPWSLDQKLAKEKVTS
ncbi:DoxX family protein [Bremerella alba]|uniref:Inner membrane protein YphA n=1 Tax=Bremerella alba TaxID=980252 RepID=A0A7V8V9E7_9BACT|nr:DoxX family protein [Bremerella alba]MBA2117159.1 Inner membrane protein YphA [Bremerella alba]